MRKRFLTTVFTVFVFTAGLFLPTCKQTTEPEILDYHNKILFTSNRSGKNQLYMMNPDGTNIRQITSEPYKHSNGKWSPDAKKIVCNTEEKSTTAGIEMTVINSDGSNRILLGWGTQMSWYPDGTKIIFSYWQGAEVGIYNNKLFSMNPDGTDGTAISDKYVGNNTFSPDGSKIAFSFNQDSQMGIVILDYPEFDNPLYINKGPSGSYDPNWSSDGSKIVFSKREISSDPNSIYIMNSDGTNIQRILNNTSDVTYEFPCFSPDGTKIIFLGYSLDGTAKCFLYIVNKDGTDLHKVIDDNNVASCDWSR